jgi:ATP-dependent Lhr-like helicase
MRFLFRWQHVLPQVRLHGRDGLATVIGQLHGVELPAPAWERSVLPARIAAFDPGLLDELCLSGVVAWGRFSPPVESDETGAATDAVRRRRGTVPALAAVTPAPKRRTAPTRAAPLALALRNDLDVLRGTRPDPASNRLSPAARVAAYLAAEGASSTPTSPLTGLLPTATEDALWELVARGIVTGDGFRGLASSRGLEDRPRPDQRLRALRGGRAPRALPAGRWALLASKREPLVASARVEAAARQLLTRYGVELRELLARKTLMPPWRELLVVLRRLEARRDRGGRFVAGLVGSNCPPKPSTRSARRAGATPTSC